MIVTMPNDYHNSTVHPVSLFQDSSQTSAGSYIPVNQ